MCNAVRFLDLTTVTVLSSDPVRGRDTLDIVIFLSRVYVNNNSEVNFRAEVFSGFNFTTT